MNNIEQNALRIAELIGYKQITNRLYTKKITMCFPHCMTNEEIIKQFSSYQGLMPIVFECNRSSINPNVSIHINDVQVWIMQDDEYLIDPITYRLEKSFIKALQLMCIKYLELRNYE